MTSWRAIAWRGLGGIWGRSVEHASSVHVYVGISVRPNILSGKPHLQAAVDMAVPGVAYAPRGGQGQGPQTFPQPPNAFVDVGNWPGATPRPQRQPRIQLTPEQGEANGPCWFYAAGACEVQNCSKACRIIIDLERAAIPSAWANWNLPKNEGEGKGFREGQQGQSGYQTDRSRTESDDQGKGPKRWEQGNRPSGGPKGEGKPLKGSRPCRFVKDGGECSHGLQCYSAWSQSPPSEQVDIAACVRQSMSNKSLSAASATDGGTLSLTGVKLTKTD
jgi:hypothetical protein